MTDSQAIGVLANMYHESRFTPSMVQGKWADPDYGKSIENPSKLKGGVGLVQWTPYEAKSALNNSKGDYNWYDLEYQVSFLLSKDDLNWNIMQTYMTETVSLDAVDCIRWFTKNFERCAGTETSSTYKSAGTSGTHYYKRWHAAEADAQEMDIIISYCTEYASNELDELVNVILKEADTYEKK